LTHLHQDGRDRDEQRDAQAKAQAWLEQQVALAADLVRGGTGQLSTDATDVERRAVMRLFDRPDRVKDLTSRLDRPERAFVRDQSRLGVSPDDLGRRIFETRLLVCEPLARGVPEVLIKPAVAAALRPLLSALSDPGRMGWAKAVADAVAAHRTRLIFEDPFQH
jgi:hypothetical protein